MSVRAIASATGTSKSAISRELAGVPFGTPEPGEDDYDPDDEPIEAEIVDEPRKITGTDGKTGGL